VSLNIAAVTDAVASHALSLGVFDRVNTHEPKVAPGNGITCAVWVDRILMNRKASGLNRTGVTLVFNIRLYQTMLSEPQDAIDPNLIGALDLLMAAFNGDYELGGTVREVDVFGMNGVALGAQAGYVPQDNKMYRVVIVTLPLNMNDVWEQVA
jgi:hypothetical protein